MAKSKKKSAQTAATVQSAKLVQHNQDNTNREEVQDLTNCKVELLSAFRKLSKEDKEDIIQFAEFLLEKQRKGECSDHAIEEWKKISKLWNKTSKEEAS